MSDSQHQDFQVARVVINKITELFRRAKPAIRLAFQRKTESLRMRRNFHECPSNFRSKIGLRRRSQRVLGKIIRRLFQFLLRLRMNDDPLHLSLLP